MATTVQNVDQWIEENKQFFLPPVCNKMMHQDGQMKLFFVGGPNQRKDYHMEAGEELFFQVKGDMVLKIVERGKHKDIPIKEGEMFLLPARMPHSPQRFQNTVGLVLERERHLDNERDGLRYYVEDNGTPTLDSLYEEWFYCDDLGTQLAPVIKKFFASEQCRTGKPIPGTIPEKCPLDLDTEKQVQMPFCFNDWISNNKDEINTQGRLAIFDVKEYQFQVYMYGKGEVEDQNELAETWIWQWEGESTVDIVGDKAYQMKTRDSLLVPKGKTFRVKQEIGSYALVCYQDPRKALTWPQN